MDSELACIQLVCVLNPPVATPLWWLVVVDASRGVLQGVEEGVVEALPGQSQTLLTRNVPLRSVHPSSHVVGGIIAA
jgi:hypothetical protein